MAQNKFSPILAMLPNFWVSANTTASMSRSCFTLEEARLTQAFGEVVHCIIEKFDIGIRLRYGGLYASCNAVLNVRTHGDEE